MEGLRGIISLQFWLSRNRFLQIGNEPKLKVAFISITVAALWFGALTLFYRGLTFFNAFPIIGPAVVDESIYIFTAFLFIMLFLSSIVICYVTYYRSAEVSFLFSKPVGEQALFHYRFLQSVIFSSWAFLFLGLPFILAYASIKGVPLWFYFFIPFFFITFIVLPSSLSSLLVLFTAKIVDYEKIKRVFFFLLGIAALIAYWYYRKNVGTIIHADGDIGQFLDNLLYHIRGFKHPLFPGCWMAKSLVNASVGNMAECAFYFAVFLSTTLFFLLLNQILAEKIFYASWLASRAGKKKMEHPPDEGLLNMLLRPLLLLPRSTAALVTKDIKVFVRDFGQWSQFLIYFGILGIYIFNLRNMPIASGNLYWKLIIAFLNLSATSLALAGFTVRFLFPLMSLEGNKIWILGLAPITFRRLIIQKFIVNLAGILLVSESLMVATNVILETGASLFYMTCGVAALASMGLVGLSVGLGTLYPNFKEDNSAKIVSGFGGTLNFVVALLYICLIIFSFALPYFSFEIYHTITVKTFHLLIAGAWLATLILTFATGFLPVILGYRHLANMEF